MTATIRRCEKCNYKTFILEENPTERKCKYCGRLMKIIAEERKNDK